MSQRLARATFTSISGASVSKNVDLRGIAQGVSDTTLYVTDFGNHTISQIAKNDSGAQAILKRYGKPGTSGSSDGELNLPLGIVTIPTSETRYIEEKGPDGKIARERVTYMDDTIWVSDRDNHRILVLDSNLKLEKYIGSEGKGSGSKQFNKPKYMSLSPCGSNVYVSDCLNQRIHIMCAKTGDFLATVPVPFEPRGNAICYNSRESKTRFLWVADDERKRICRLNLETAETRELDVKGFGLDSVYGIGSAFRANPKWYLKGKSLLAVADKVGNQVVFLEGEADAEGDDLTILSQKMEKTKEIPLSQPDGLCMSSSEKKVACTSSETDIVWGIEAF